LEKPEISRSDGSQLNWLRVNLVKVFSFVLFLTICCTTSKEVPADADRDGLCPEAGRLLAESAKIDERGAFRDTANYELNESVLKLAECYARTSDDFAAEVVTRMLLRYAEVVREWPLINRDGKVSETVDFTQWDLGGLWGGEWIYIDLAKSANLARAFELLANNTAVDEVGRQLGVDARTVIREQLLRYLVDFNLRFGRGSRLGTNTQEAAFPFSNMDPYRLQKLLVFGRVVDPAYIHIAVRMLRLFPTVGFFRDGFWHEGTVSYHRQVVGRLVGLADDLVGYSDPPGYEHTGYTTLFGDNYLGVPGRFENLEPLGEARRDYARLKAPDRALTLPDGRMLAKNDTHHTAMGNRSNAPTQSTCLFALRHCVLVENQGIEKLLVHLDYGGTEGHEHYDALHMDLWAHDRLILGDGTYRGFSPRDWNMSTSAHNTVWVDRIDQDSRFDDRATLTVYDEIDGVGNHLWQGYGQGNSENAGQLLAADLSGGPIQYVAADATQAYDAHISLENYQRTLVLVEGEDRGSYIVDAFYVNGGLSHEWMLHGDLSSDSTLHTSLDEQPAEGTMGPYLKIERVAKASGDWSSDLDYPEDGHRLRTYHLGNTESEVTIARGPAQVREGEANYLAIRKVGPRNIFIAVHVPQGDEFPIENVTPFPLSYEGDVCIRVKIEFASGRSDEVAILTDQGAAAGGGCDMGGSYITHIATAPNGNCLWHYQGEMATSTSSWQQGTIEVLRQQACSPKNGFRIANWPASDGETAPALLHLKLPNGTVESYLIRRLERFADRSVFVEVEGEPGLLIETEPGVGEPSSRVKQLYYPARGFVGHVAYRTTTNAFQRCDAS
jgi:hypothetical protein